MKYSSVLTLALLSYLMFACVSDNKNTHATADAPVESVTAEKTAAIMVGYENFKLIGSIEKEDVSPKEDDEITKECENWLVEAADLENILSRMEQVSSEEAFTLCYQYPCDYKGAIQDGELVYDMLIQSGGSIVLFTENEGEEKYFILKEDYAGNPFFGICDCCE